MMTTPAQRLEELKRELATRQRVYPGWVQQKKIDQPTADHRIQVLLDLIAELELDPRYQQPRQGLLFAPDQLPASSPRMGGGGPTGPEGSIPSPDNPRSFYS